MQEITKRNPLVSEAPEPNPSYVDAASHSRRDFTRMILAGLFLRGSRFSRADDPPETAPEIASRKFVIGGGGHLPEPIHRKFVEMAGGKKAKVLVVSSASEDAKNDRNIGSYWKWGHEVGIAKLMHAEEPEEADQDEFVDDLNDATAVWFGGGKQEILVKRYRDTRFLKELHKFSERGGIIGGSSAGAAALSKIMIVKGSPVPELGDGFGFVPWAVFDQHHTRAGRIERLLAVTEKHPKPLGFGIEDRTAVILECTADKVIAIVMGEGNVRFCQNGKVLKIAQDGEKINLGELPMVHADDNDHNALFRFK